MNARSLQAELLQETLDNALRSPFYRQLWKGRAISVDDLESLPIIGRADLIAAGQAALVDGEVPTVIGITSGSSYVEGQSSGALYHYHNEQERVIANDVADHLLSGVPDPKPLSMRLISSDHGLDFHGGRKGIFAVPFDKQYHHVIVSDLLTRRFAFEGFSERIETLASALNKLKLLTTLRLQGNQPNDSDIKLITSFAWQLTRRWQGIIESYWKAPVSNVYGMSEVPGLHARCCPHCGYFHFSRASFVELLELDSDRPLSHGVGRLIATALYPLAQIQPFVRYDAGDIFSSRGLCPVTRRKAFEFLGRSRKVVRFRSAGCCLSHVALVDVLDSVPDVAVSSLPSEARLGVRSPCGEPVHKVGLEGETLIVDVECVWSPGQHAERAAGVADQLRSLIRQCIVPATENADPGSVPIEVRLAAPGTL